MPFAAVCAIIPLAEKKQHLGVAQLVARYLGVVEAVGSSPVTQTNIKAHLNLAFQWAFLLYIRSPALYGEKVVYLYRCYLFAGACVVQIEV